MERIWLAATAKGLPVQPHGVLPQYLTKLDVGIFIRKQERDLSRVFGDEFRQYTSRVRRIIPFARP